MLTAPRSWVLTLVCCALLTASLSAQPVPNPKQVITKARASYYSLADQGMAGFQCSATPDWEKMLQDQRKQDSAAADSAMKTLSQIRFVIKVDNGKLKLTHNDIPGQSKQMNDALAQIYSGMDQMTSGFFDTWSLFMLSAPLPEVDSKYQLQSGGQVYLLNYLDGKAEVATIMGRDFAISELKVTTNEYDSAIHPAFNATPKGFVFSSYTASYKSKDPKEATQLVVFIDYQEIDRLQILKKLALTGSYGGVPFAVDIAFSDCTVTRKVPVT
jgi:hypothetical protein